MFQIKGLASCLKGFTQSKIITDIALRHKRKLFCKYDNIWYEFPNSGAIIIPFDVANEYAKKHKLLLEEPLALNNIDFSYLNKTINRIPVVAILGHFNHGKTTLIDAYAGTNLVQQEIHAITQVIRTRMLSLNMTQHPSPATSAPSEEDVVTFVDTPGQEIFYRMRDYGAAIADLALLVVSAEDGICQQTEESIGIVESLGIPVVVCINKIDLPSVTAVPTRVADVEQQARQYNVLENAEFIAISAKHGTNLDLLSNRIRQTIKDLKQIELRGAVRVLETASTDQRRLQQMFISGTGTVLNIWNSRQTGVVLHLIVQHGEVYVGSHFSAGGWSGSVRKVVRDNQAAVQSATAGMGVHLTVIMSKLCDDPRPLGDRIFFHGPRSGTKLSRGDMERSREAAEGVMLQNQLQAKIGSYAISDALAEHYWLEDANERVKNSVDYHRKKAIALAAAEEEEEEGSEETSQKDSDVDIHQEEEEDMEECRVVVKADTDLSLNTIMDARDEAVARFEAGGVAPPPNRVVFSGVGDVTVRDVTIAQAANALIVTYGVGIEPDAARLSAQSGGVRMLGIDCMQDAVDAVVVPGPSSNNKPAKGERDTISMNNTLVRKPKRRNTTSD